VGVRPWRPRLDFAIAFALGAAALAWALLGPAHLPMADLPQHAAQVAGWRRLAIDAAYARTHELNLWTPNLLGYALARLLATVWPVERALAVAVVLGLLATPWVVARELARRGGDPWWALALLPLGFTMAFYWGLFNFIVGVALVPLYLGLVERESRPSTVLTVGLILVAAHAILFAFASTAATLALIAARRARLRGMWPVWAPWPVLLMWMVVTRGHEALARDVVHWHLEAVRLIQLPREVTGLSAGVEPVQAVCAVLLLASPFALGARPSRRLARWMPALLAIALFFFAPFSASGNACLYPRFAALILPLTWLALEPAERVLAPRLRLLVPLLALGALGSIGLRVRAFAQEARDLDAVLARIPPGRRLLGLCYAPMSGVIAAPVYDHMAMWYEVAGGEAEPSFASRYPMLVRYRAGVPHVAAEYDPRHFRFDRDGGFDDYLVRAPIDLGPRLFGGAAPLVVHEGMYWLYGR
jgi:hypothetical protein